MTDAEATHQETELDPESSTDLESSTDETAADANNEESSESGYDPEAATEEGVNADYQARLAEFDEVESVPVVSVPVPSSELDESDLKVQGPGGQSG